MNDARDGDRPALPPTLPPALPPSQPGDLQRPGLIHLKGWLFLVIAVVCAGLLVLRTQDWPSAALLALCIWGSCRFYYYAFYVIERYIDPGFRFSGLGDLLLHLIRRRR